MTEPEVDPKKYFDQIEVFGSMEKRSWIHGPKSPKRFFINEPKCPVRNPFDRIDGVVREEGIKLFDNLVWQQIPAVKIPVALSRASVLSLVLNAKAASR
jgi:hypothetical protein